MTVDSTRAPAGATVLTKDKPDADLIGAWGRRSIALATFIGLPSVGEKGHDRAAEEAELAIVDAAEKEICSAVATTTFGVEVQLWTAFFHADVVTKPGDDEAANVMDIDHFIPKEADFEWRDRLILAALRSLRGLRAEIAK